MKNKKYLKSMSECVNGVSENSVIDKNFSDEMILESIYQLQMQLAEYLTQEDLYNCKAEVTLQEIQRLENLLN